MLFYAIIGLINAVTSTFLGLFVYYKNRKEGNNKTFALFCLSVAMWSYAYFIWQMSMNPESALFWSRALMVGAIFIPVTYFHFITVFLNIYQRKKNLLFFGYTLSFIFLIFNFSPLFVKNVEPELSFLYWPKPGIAYHPFLLMFFGYVIYSWYLMLQDLKKITGTKALQIKYVLFGTLIGFLGGFTNYPLWYNIPIPPIGNGLVVFSIIFITFAITKYHLFEIRVILTELLVAVMGIILLVLPFLMPSIELKLLTGFVLFLFILFGYFLIKYTHSEMKRKEEAEALAVRERVLREEFEGLAKQRGEMAEQFQTMAIRSEGLRKSEEEFARQAEEAAKRERKLREEAEKLAKIKTEFMILSTHHWRTPLSEIKGKLSMILEKKFKELPEELWLELQKIYRSNETAIKTANQLIYLSQIELGEYPPNKKEVDLEEILGSSFLEGKIEAERKGLNFTFEKPKEPLPRVSIDENQAGEVFKIILDNAVRYTQKGGIKVWTERKENSLLTAIKDSGAGIEKEALALIFEGLAKGKAGYLYRMEGPGLNLYIAKRLVEQNKGKIWAESKGKSKGSTFYVELPIR